MSLQMVAGVYYLLVWAIYNLRLNVELKLKLYLLLLLSMILSNQGVR